MADGRIDPGELRRVRTLSEVVEFLSDELDWPITSTDLEDISFDYTAEELGIPEDQVPKLLSLRELQPLVADQPWGIFFIEFAGPKLPVGALRRLLRGLVTRKRATGDGSKKTWGLEDLLFIITTDSGESVELHLVAFFEDDERKVQIRSLPWRPDQSPEQHLRRLAHELLPRLAWPETSGDADAWRESWRAAFPLRHGEVIASSKLLAQRMADTARFLRDRIGEGLEREAGSGPLADLLDEVRHELVADVDEARFADMCAQTLVYGLLGSRLADPDAFGASPTLFSVPMSNSFLTAFFERVSDHVAEIDSDEAKLEQLVADLRDSPVEGILDQFQSTAKGGDPVIHFYEDFLALYDSKLRAAAGAFYTPQPVVSFMVRAVDDILRAEFGLSAGIADDSTWEEVADGLGIDVPDGVDPGSAFVSMLDPATGTGTFLVEWLEQARLSFSESEVDGDWPTRLRETVFPSMHAFELMLAPYAIAHMKLALALENQGVDQLPPEILLADTLDYPAAELQIETMADPVALEGRRADHLKQNERFTVIVGNPPYHREQRASSGDTSKRKGGVVRHGVPGIEPLLADYLEPLSKAGMGVHAKNLYNDYVYFWRWATWQATERQPGPAVVAFITASSFLSGKSFGSMRQHLREAFDQLWIIDLGGESRGAVAEANVFDIQTPVAICIAVRSGIKSTDDASVSYARLGGTREQKLATLASSSLAAIDFEPVAGAGFAYLSPLAKGGYHDWPSIEDLLPWSLSGCKVSRTWPIAVSHGLAAQRWKALVTSGADARPGVLKESRDRKADASIAPMFGGSGQKLKPVSKLELGDEPEAFKRYSYRSLDRQWLVADNRVVDFRSPHLWRISSDQQIYLTTLTTTKLGRGPVMIAAPYVPDLDHFRGSFGAKSTFPVWRDPECQHANLPSGLLERLTDSLGRDISDLEFVTYLYGLGSTAAFSERFATALGAGAGPFRIPITADGALFGQVAALGALLLNAHTWGERLERGPDWKFGDHRVAQVSPVTDYPEKFAYDPDARELLVGAGRFGPVEREVWEFEVSGLKVLQSWLGNRMASPKGRRSSPLDEITPEEWTFTEELLELIGVLEFTCDMTSTAAELLERVMTGELIDPATLPEPDEAARRAPKG